MFAAPMNQIQNVRCIRGILNALTLNQVSLNLRLLYMVELMLICHCTSQIKYLPLEMWKLSRNRIFHKETLSL